MDKKDLDEVLRLHKLWLNGQEGGRRAVLTEADLTEADLREADLTGAVLRGVNGRATNTILQFSGVGSVRRMTTYWAEENKVWCGCFTGTMAEFEAKITEKYGDSQHGLAYKAAVQFLKAAALAYCANVKGLAE